MYATFVLNNRIITVSSCENATNNTTVQPEEQFKKYWGYSDKSKQIILERISHASHSDNTPNLTTTLFLVEIPSVHCDFPTNGVLRQVETSEFVTISFPGEFIGEVYSDYVANLMLSNAYMTQSTKYIAASQ